MVITVLLSFLWDTAIGLYTRIFSFCSLPQELDVELMWWKSFEVWYLANLYILLNVMNSKEIILAAFDNLSSCMLMKLFAGQVHWKCFWLLVSDFLLAYFWRFHCVKPCDTSQAVEDDPKYWEAISSALAIGWLDVVVCVFSIFIGSSTVLFLDFKHVLLVINEKHIIRLGT